MASGGFQSNPALKGLGFREDVPMANNICNTALALQICPAESASGWGLNISAEGGGKKLKKNNNSTPSNRISFLVSLFSPLSLIPEIPGQVLEKGEREKRETKTN